MRAEPALVQLTREPHGRPLGDINDEMQQQRTREMDQSG